MLLVSPDSTSDAAVSGAFEEECSTSSGPDWCVLVVDDDPLFLETVEAILDASACPAMACTDAETALQAAREHEGPIALLVTDVIMPGISGPKLAERLRASHPETRVLYMSGYGPEILSKYGVHGPAAFVSKPLDLETLLDHVRGALA